MASRRHASLKPHLNQVRNWVELGATDIWIAHQLGSTPASIAAFRQKNGLLRTGGAERPAPAAPRPTPAAAAAGAESGTTAAKRPRRRSGAKRGDAPTTDAPAVETQASEPAPVTASGDVAAERAAADVAPAEEPAVAGTDAADDGGAGERPRRRRGRRGGRGRGRPADADTPLELEGVFDHGEDGFGLWLDAAVRDAAVYREHWSGYREVVVNVTPDEIVIRRVPGPDEVAEQDDVDATDDAEPATGGQG